MIGQVFHYRAKTSWKLLRRPHAFLSVHDMDRDLYHLDLAIPLEGISTLPRGYIAYPKYQENVRDNQECHSVYL